MSLLDCPECWDHPCTCGHEYKNMSLSQLRSMKKNYGMVLAQIDSAILAKQDAEDYRLDEPGRR